MSDMLIRIDTEKAIADIEARLGMLYEKAPDVMRKSLNDTAKKTGRELAKLAQERYQIKTIKFAKEFKYTYASKSRLEAVLTSSGEMLAASKFKISPTKPSSSKEGSPPVKLAVLASESPKTITNSRGLTAFLQNTSPAIWPLSSGSHTVPGQSTQNGAGGSVNSGTMCLRN